MGVLEAGTLHFEKNGSPGTRVGDKKRAQKKGDLGLGQNRDLRVRGEPGPWAKRGAKR